MRLPRLKEDEDDDDDDKPPPPSPKRRRRRGRTHESLGAPEKDAEAEEATRGLLRLQDQRDLLRAARGARAARPEKEHEED
eukprot:CAMPEP_0206123632 /NCGR_PEP_ID=MMETSP1472-20131121/4905_1 /ASSEMBLY_ACC=CAM_ASM_001108 /TAXON_ID=41880 /ORGANISM="Pycnococcus provasolii, Strain RCC251" /LENGTH=80 /DNA_ID=CAMNT_0053514265 /DNA_START=255 /DNA_END=494 /DNA_ORIENTATION=-